MRRILMIVVALSSGLGLLVACGGAEETPQPTGRSMTDTANAAAAPDAQAPAMARSSAPTGGAAGSRPVVEDVRMSPREPQAGVPLTVVVESSDPDGDLVRNRVQWLLNGREVGKGHQSSITLPDLKKGDRVEVVVVASDGQLESEPRRFTARVPNRAPMMDAIRIEPAGARPGDPLTANPEARDPDNDALRYAYRWSVNGLEKGGDREFKTNNLKRGDRVRVNVVASDGESESRSLDSPELVMGNTPPRISKLPELETDSGEFRYGFEAYDADGDRNLRFFLDKAPDGMSVDAITGMVTWKPDAKQVGKHEVEIGVKDAADEGTTFVFELTVSAAEGETPANAAEGETPANAAE